MPNRLDLPVRSQPSQEAPSEDEDDRESHAEPTFGHLKSGQFVSPWDSLPCENQLVSARSHSLGECKAVKENQEALLRHAVQETELCATDVWDRTLQKESMSGVKDNVAKVFHRKIIIVDMSAK
uniref:Uncharacterized protein n=1 Tax=Aegilops tauschii TaxID=37682 RepID=M8C7M1_AEGTA